jgi:probable addiction module antidote protein
MEILQTMVFQRWEQNLRDRRAKTLIATRLFRLANGLAGDVKPVGEGSPVHWIIKRSSTMKKLTQYDPATALVDDEEIAVFMADALETGDAAYIAKALGVVARAKGMANIAAETGLSREQLYRSFSEKGNPTLKTTLAVMKALGIELTLKK